MALIKCSECGGTISDKAKACPHCGCPIEGNEIEEKKGISKGKMSIASIVSFIISTIIFFLILPCFQGFSRRLIC